jgi:hypothetical protein
MKFRVCMSLVAGEPIRLVIPSALQMGWNESPAYFCATTDTAGDVAQTWIDTKEPQRRHPMESFTTAAQPARLQSSTSPSYQMLAVYVDDFLLAAVENKDKLLQRMAPRNPQCISLSSRHGDDRGKRPRFQKETGQRGCSLGNFQRDPGMYVEWV